MIVLQESSPADRIPIVGAAPPVGGAAAGPAWPGRPVWRGGRKGPAIQEGLRKRAFPLIDALEVFGVCSVRY